MIAWSYKLRSKLADSFLSGDATSVVVSDAGEMKVKSTSMKVLQFYNKLDVYMDPFRSPSGKYVELTSMLVGIVILCAYSVRSADYYLTNDGLSTCIVIIEICMFTFDILYFLLKFISCHDGAARMRFVTASRNICLVISFTSGMMLALQRDCYYSLAFLRLILVQSQFLVLHDVWLSDTIKVTHRMRTVIKILVQTLTLIFIAASVLVILETLNGWVQDFGNTGAYPQWSLPT